MKTSLICGLLSLALTTSALSHEDKQFPDENILYRPGVDVGMSQYQAKSLHKTGKIVLTFDDGPHATRTPKILDLLKEYNVKATFFVVTTNITEETLPIVERIVNEGHQLASHHHQHIDSNTQSEKVFQGMLRDSITKLEGILDNMGVHQREMFYRFPYGAYGKAQAYHHLNSMKKISRELYGDNCINFAFWDIDTSDWVPNMTSQEVAQNVRAYMLGGAGLTFVRQNGVYVKKPFTVKNPPGGGVILMHDIQEKTYLGTKLILEMAKEQGWQVVPLDSVDEFAYGNRECVFKGLTR